MNYSFCAGAALGFAIPKIRSAFRSRPGCSVQPARCAMAFSDVDSEDTSCHPPEIARTVSTSRSCSVGPSFPLLPGTSCFPCSAGGQPAPALLTGFEDSSPAPSNYFCVELVSDSFSATKSSPLQSSGPGRAAVEAPFPAPAPGLATQLSSSPSFSTSIPALPPAPGVCRQCKPSRTSTPSLLAALATPAGNFHLPSLVFASTEQFSRASSPFLLKASFVHLYSSIHELSLLTTEKASSWKAPV